MSDFMGVGRIIVAAIALLYAIDLLVGNEGGVLTNLQETYGRTNAHQVPTTPPAVAAEKPAHVEEADPDPWQITQDTPPLDDSDASALQDVANGRPTEEPTPGQQRRPLQPQAGSPEFPYVPLPKPALTAAGAKIDYPTSDGS